MKKSVCLVTLAYLAFLASNFTLKAQSTSAEVLAKSFIEALRSQNINQMIELMPSATLYRSISPSETQGKTDAEIEVMKKVAEQRLKQHFSQILASASKESVTLPDLRFQDSKLEAIPSQDADLYFLELRYSYLNKISKINLVVCQEKNGWYLLEIARSADIFAALFE